MAFIPNPSVCGSFPRSLTSPQLLDDELFEGTLYGAPNRLPHDEFSIVLKLQSRVVPVEVEVRVLTLRRPSARCRRLLYLCSFVAVILVVFRGIYLQSLPASLQEYQQYTEEPSSFVSGSERV